MMNIKKYNYSLRGTVRAKHERNNTINYTGIDIVKAIKDGYNSSINVPQVGGNKDFGLSRGTQITSEQVEALKQKLQNLEKKIEAMNIDTSTNEGRLEALMYFYKIMQKDIKYFNPLIRLGSWESYAYEYAKIGVVSPDTPYGALIENYALCEGISTGFELLCNYFDMDCDSIGVKNCGVEHAINRLRLDNGQVTYIDLTAEIGMSQDGKYIDANTRRIVPIEKVDTTTKYFLVNSAFLEGKGYRSEEFSKYKSTCMLQKSKEELVQRLENKMKSQINIIKPKITIKQTSRDDISK